MKQHTRVRIIKESNLVIMNILGNYVTQHFNKDLAECTEQELYKALLNITRERSRELPTREDKKK